MPAGSPSSRETEPVGGLVRGMEHSQETLAPPTVAARSVDAMFPVVLDIAVALAPALGRGSRRIPKFPQQNRAALAGTAPFAISPTSHKALRVTGNRGTGESCQSIMKSVERINRGCSCRRQNAGRLLRSDSRHRVWKFGRRRFVAGRQPLAQRTESFPGSQLDSAIGHQLVRLTVRVDWNSTQESAATVLTCWAADPVFGRTGSTAFPDSSCPDPP